MFPGGVNPKQMAQMMKQMGIKVEDLKAKRIIIETDSGKKLIFEDAQVQAINMHGQKTYTITGTPREEVSIPQEDIAMVAEQTNSSKEEATKALEETNGDIAEAILKLKK